VRKNIGWHTRSYQDNTQKLSGGSFGGDFSLQTVERLTKVFFTVRIRPGGFATFVDRSGRDVSLYFKVDPESTTLGQEARAKWNVEQLSLMAAREKLEAEQRREVEDLMDGLSHEEIVRRLSNKE